MIRMNAAANLILRMIPAHVNNRIVAFVYDAGTLLKTTRAQAGRNFAHNVEQLKKLFLDKTDFYIENQAELTSLKLGKKYTFAYGGCGAIALHNLRVALGEAMRAEDTAAMFLEIEERGQAFFGLAGFSPKALLRYLKRHGYAYHVYYGTDSKTIDALASARGKEEKSAFRYRTFLVTGYNNSRTLGDRIHTVSITREKTGFVIHNGYRFDVTKQCYKQSRTYRTLSDAVHHIDAAGYSKPIFVAGVQ